MTECFLRTRDVNFAKQRVWAVLPKMSFESGEMKLPLERRAWTDRLTTPSPQTPFGFTHPLLLVLVKGQNQT